MSARWLPRAVLLAVHERQLEEHGGATGIRDAGMFESALARPENLAAYGEPDLPALAAAYAFGIMRNHPFVDGNKRTGFVAAELFLAANGKDLAAPDEECIEMAIALAAGGAGEADFAAWLRANV